MGSGSSACRCSLGFAQEDSNTLALQKKKTELSKLSREDSIPFKRSPPVSVPSKAHFEYLIQKDIGPYQVKTLGTIAASSSNLKPDESQTRNQTFTSRDHPTQTQPFSRRVPFLDDPRRSTLVQRRLVTSPSLDIE